jgi:glutamine amidotransferase
MGWNCLIRNNDCPILSGLGEDEYVYFVHSYAARCDDKDVAAYCDYGGKVTALVYDGKFVYGSQFHPEKSGKTGLKMLKNFAELIK